MRLQCQISSASDVLTQLSVSPEPVLIYVDSDEQEFRIHEHLLTSSSDFFKNALKNEWAEGHARKVKLPEVDVNAFMIWEQWLYARDLFVTETDGQRRSLVHHKDPDRLSKHKWED